jgi:hypothetical protein
MHYRQWDDHYAARFFGYSPFLGPNVSISKLGAKRKLGFRARIDAQPNRTVAGTSGQGYCGIE